MLPRLIPIAFILILSCRTASKEWQTLNFGAFKLKTPPGWSKVEEKGIDSYVGALTNGKDTLRFDYGWYDLDLSEEDAPIYLYAKDTVNGLTATLIIPDTAGKGHISMHIPKVKGKSQFTIYGTNIKSTDTILKIYKSILFETSDSTQNPPLTFSKFIYRAHGSGKLLFYRNCASCHSIYKIILAPPLKEVVPKRSNEWIYTFLTDRKHFKSDSLHDALSAGQNYHCLEFPDLQKDELDLIIDYIKTK